MSYLICSFLIRSTELCSLLWSPLSKTQNYSGLLPLHPASWVLGVLPRLPWWSGPGLSEALLGLGLASVARVPPGRVGGWVPWLIEVGGFTLLVL